MAAVRRWEAALPVASLTVTSSRKQEVPGAPLFSFHETFISRLKTEPLDLSEL